MRVRSYNVIHVILGDQLLLTENFFSIIELRRTVIKYPRLFTLSLKKIKFMVGFLKFELNFDPKSVRQILYYSPNVLGLNPLSNVKAKIDFLCKDLDFTEDEVKKVITGMPTIFQLNIESNLLPKIEYLRNIFDDDQAKLRKIILVLPSLLGYSLENRIKPRMTQLLRIHEDPSRITVAITLTDKKFEEWFQNRVVSIQYQKRLQGEARLRDIEDEVSRRKAKVVRWTR